MTTTSAKALSKAAGSTATKTTAGPGVQLSCGAVALIVLPVLTLVLQSSGHRR
jgi:hypothetical protein